MENIINDMKAYFASLVAPEWHWGMVGIDILLVIGLLFAFKHTLGMYCGVSVRQEIAEKDNPAFGTVVGMLFLSFFLIMSAASTGDDLVTWYEEIMLMGSYGIAGIVMLLLSKIIFDKVSMRSFHIQEQLNKGNLAAGIVAGGNLLATALIVFAFMSWVKGTDINAICVVAYGWVLSQFLLSLATFVRTKMYNSVDGESLADNIEQGNVAVAIRFTGYRLAMALAPLIALPHYPYEAEYGYLLATEIFLTAILLGFIYVVATMIAKKIVFRSVDFCDEINRQKNTGVAMIEACIVLGIAFLNYGLLK